MAEQEQQPDDRPRPRYGELAPPGWVWHPPADADRLDTSRRVDDDTETQEQPAPAAPYGAHTPPEGGYYSQNARPERPAPTWNLTLTVLLTVFGFFGMSYSIATLQAIPASMQLLHSTNGLGDYTPAPVVGTLVLAGTGRYDGTSASGEYRVVDATGELAGLTGTAASVSTHADYPYMPLTLTYDLG